MRPRALAAALVAALPADLTPAARVHRFLDALEREDMEAFFALWAEDSVQVMPYAPDDFPERLEGIEAIRGQYAPLPEAFASMRYDERTVRIGADGAAVATFHGRNALAGSDTVYATDYVGVFRFDDDGLIRECFDPLAIVEAFGRPEDFGAASDGGSQ